MRCGRLWAGASVKSGCGWPSNGPRAASWRGCWAVEGPRRPSAQPGATCDGVAYRITPQVFDHLDHREKNGYLRCATEMTFDDGTHAQGLTYIAGAENAAYMGPTSDPEIAQQIAMASGPSGPNRDYLTALAKALRDLGKQDAHVFAIERYLQQYLEKSLHQSISN